MHREDLAAPADGGAAKGAEAAFVEAEVCGSGVAGLRKEALAAGFEGEAAGFEEGDFDSLLAEAVGEG